MTRKIKIGHLSMGGDSPILIQSMTNTKTADVKATVDQILKLEKAGCELVRVAVPDLESAEAIAEIKKQVHIPISADIHFDYRLAIAAIENGADKIRLNPGNIGSIERVKAVVEKAKAHEVPIRIGVNGGSLERDIYEKYQGVTPEALVESAMRHVKILESLSFFDLAISIKSSDIDLTVKAYQALSQEVDYPLHIGITEAGTVFTGTVKSAIGIGILLYQGIGQTIRVSLTGDPVEEIRVAKKILEVMGLRKFGAKVISCPTCGRTEVDLISIADEVERRLENCEKNITVAIMGCVVNGPGEAREADIGIAGGRGQFILFKKGQVIKKITEESAVETLLDEISKM